ncbi:hypothetical protein [Parapedobacter sp. 2B3]|uniref:hypothetical protein n=1 Tax=Parapedobacter sp. 2B3 TaxID=3342381 RepID=UPI0035B61286
MLALALLFAVIIGLLWLIARLLQRYFDAYAYLNRADDDDRLQQHLQEEKEIDTYRKRKTDINSVIDERLSEMEKRFPSQQSANEPTEMFMTAFKNMINNALSILKEEKRDSGH